ncbi:Fic family protein [Alkalitalea saponilacus]|uniref:Predicted transcriptional regulator, contains HTH domain n=1 Tax=Alkalitalea saponilacus TaxID=889453 RepID=A0A1T5HUE5_9BACT|nr:RNA-binding domain-containing protein [Alkalitalea saponilacus]ASB50337.1 transcriptional regulator [Alkalitalea saponilacus]ASB50343.1 transcriptional regulator [Alkalitalea saponilacus]ASB50462.1 transcriptional regulator [Alkalitalea saponilacus]SKC24294.1 Predicted transcriptional regulator, contains HTH domain [Alkalitalea saponilacus]
MSETNRIEYKQELNNDVDIEKEVIAFLNYHEGGIIYVGIDKQGKVVGVSDIDSDMLKIKDRIKNNISPSAMGLFDVVAESKEGKELIKIIVAGGTEKPYFKKKFGMTEKGCFIRTGTAAEPMPQSFIDKLFASRTRNSLGKIRSNRQDLTFEQLKIYYEEKGLNLTKHFKQNLELLTEDNKLNYVAYLLADENGTSIKVAKYSGTDRVDLIENNEYGYCSLIKATKRVIDKLELENKTISKITYKERIDSRLWNAVALREAIINAIIHNDYTREVPPKFEIFSDRLEITSYGGLFEGMTQEDFFDGLSLPRNKELMRIYKDLGMVEQLGSGVPRILQAYNKDCFKFSENFLRMIFPATEKIPMQVNTQVPMQVSTQVEELIKIFTGEHTRQDLQDKLNLANRENFRKNYLQSALDEKLIELTIPEKPNSSKQKYRLTEKGILMKERLI